MFTGIEDDMKSRGWRTAPKNNRESRTMSRPEDVGIKWTVEESLKRKGDELSHQHASRLDVILS